MVQIELEDDWMVESDKFQYILGKKVKTDTDKGYTLRKRTYHVDIESALGTYFERSIRNGDKHITTFKELKQIMKRKQAELEKIRKELELI